MTEENKTASNDDIKIVTHPPNILLNSDYEVLVLSGGGTKGVLQLGMLHGMYTNKKINFNRIHAYVGTSIGAISCFLLILGYLPVEILSHIC